MAAPLMTKSRGCVRACVCVREFVRTLFSQATPGTCPCAPFFTCRRRSGVTGGRRWGDNLGCCRLPALSSAAPWSARLRSVKPRIYTASALRLRRRERRREGSAKRRGAAHTPARTNCGLSVSLSPHGGDALPSPSQFGDRISSRGEDLYSCFICIFKHESNICQSFCSFFLFFFSFSKSLEE